MKNNKKIFLIILIIALLISGLSFLLLKEDNLDNDIIEQDTEEEKLEVKEILEIIKTDKDYDELSSSFIKGFDFKIIDYFKLGPKEYEEIKNDWQKKGLHDRIEMIEEIDLTDSTYWVELKNKQKENKGLRTLIDIKNKESLILIASLQVSIDMGL